MSQQITFEQAEARAKSGMHAALVNAERKMEKWGDLAYLFLELYCRSHLSFISEDVSDKSKDIGLHQPPSDRAWGAIYRRAIKAGMIVQDGTGRSRRRNGSVCLRWRSKIFCVPAL